ncbi:MAG: DNA internalization-related competence protein ComEC/Rec2 [Chloroflexi bacterium]|nr:DNA internalization-related competence protein ComEC/Rec2 [Chloroflexota bacterium]
MTILYISLAYLIGISAGRLLWDVGLINCGFPVWLWLLLLLALPTPFAWERRWPPPTPAPLRWPRSAGFTPPAPEFGTALWAALLLAVCAGLLRFAGQPLTPCFTPDDLAYYNTPDSIADDGPQVSLTGFVNNYPTAKNSRQQIYVQVESIRRDGVERSVTGQVRMTVGTQPRYVYGQPLQISGVLTEPPVFDSFDYRAYLARKGIHSQMQRPRLEVLDGPRQGSPIFRFLYALRARGESVVNRLLPEPYAALSNGMLLGIEAGIPDDLYEQFNLTGTSHVIVISGSNVAIVSGVLMAFFARLLGRRRGLWPTLAGIGLYALLVGGDPAVMRAALMGSLFVVATVLKRQSTALLSLGAACWAMTLLNPLTLWDVGFELSSSATAGLILFSPGLTSALGALWPRVAWGGHLTGGLMERGGSVLRGLLQDGLLVTLAANLTTLPLVVYYFGRLSLVSLLTNLLIVPVQPYIMLLGGLGLLVGMAGITLLAQPLLWIAYLCLVWTVAMVRWSATLPWASLEVMGYGAGGLAATYGLLFAWHWRKELAMVAAWRPRISGPLIWRWAGTIGLPGLVVGALLLWQVLLSRPDGYLHLYFLDIGQGDGILVQTPSGRQMLIDGGSDPQRLFAQLGGAMPFWDRSLDLVVATHPDWDHMGGQIGLPERFAIGEALISENLRGHEDFAEWQEAMQDAGAGVAGQEQDGWIDLGDGVALWVLWPPPEEAMPAVEDDDKNERSLVLRLVYGELSVLLTGDAGLPAEQAMLKSGQPLVAHILKVGHHGSRNSTGPDFVQAAQPEVAIIQVGENRYGHPAPSVLETLAGRLVLRNDVHGRIHVRSDGARMWIETERRNPLPDGN